MDIYKKPTDSNDPFTPNQPSHCLKNIPFSLAKRIYANVENKNVKEKRYKEMKEKNITNTKIS